MLSQSLRSLLVCGGALVVALPGHAFAQSDSPLAGPTVHAKAQPTIVAYDFDGNLKVLHDQPAAVALELLEITDAEREACMRIIAERNAIVDGVFIGHTDLVTRLATAAGAGNQRETLSIANELYEMLKPVRDRGELEAELASVLHEDAATELRMLVDAYRDAHIEQIKKDVLKSEGKEIGSFGAGIRRRFIQMGFEIEQAFYRYQMSSFARVDDILDVIDVAGEKRETIRQRILDFGQRTMGKATKADGFAFVAEIMNMLEPAQRGKFLRYLIEQEQAKKALERSIAMRMHL